jgi:hypothetical protein
MIFTLTSTKGRNTSVVKIYEVDDLKILIVSTKTQHIKSDYLVKIFCEST